MYSNATIGKIFEDVPLSNGIGLLGEFVDTQNIRLTVMDTGNEIMGQIFNDETELYYIHIVTFDGSGGTVYLEGTLTGENGTLVESLPIPIRDENWQFDGWFTALTGGTQVTANTVFSSDSIIFAQWTEISDNDDYATSPPNGNTNDSGTVPPNGNLPPTTPPQQPETPQQPSLPLDTQPEASAEQPLLPLLPRRPVQRPPSDYVYLLYNDDVPLAEAVPLPITIPPPLQAVNRLIFTIGSTQFIFNNQPHTAVGTPFIDPATNRMMVPLYTIAEAISAAVEWCSDTRSALVHLPTGILAISADEMLPNGMGSVMIVNDRIFIPLRFVMYAFNAAVEWDSTARAANISW